MNIPRRMGRIYTAAPLGEELVADTTTALFPSSFL